MAASPPPPIHAGLGPCAATQGKLSCGCDANNCDIFDDHQQSVGLLVGDSEGFPLGWNRDTLQRPEVGDPPHLFSSFLSFSIVGADVKSLAPNIFAMHQICCTSLRRCIPTTDGLRVSTSACALLDFSTRVLLQCPMTASHLSCDLSVDVIVPLFLRHHPSTLTLLLASPGDRIQLPHHHNWWITSLGLACNLLRKQIERVLLSSSQRFVPQLGI